MTSANDSPNELIATALARHVSLSREATRSLMALSYVLRTFDAGTYLVREGELPTDCAILMSGYAYRQKLNSDGARQILSLHLPGEALDLQNLFLDISDHNVQTLTHATVAIIPRTALAQLVQSHPSIGKAIMIAVLIESSIYREWLLNIGRRSARARIAHLLCEFGTRLAARGAEVGDVHELPMTQEQLGDALGLTSVHVNRTLRSLELDGLLTRTKRSICFPAWERLRHVADFSPGYLHLDQKQGRH